MKKSKNKKYQKRILTLIIGLLVLFYTWMTDTVTTVHLPQSDQPAELYSNQKRDDLKKTFITAIQEAKQSVLLIVYSLTDQQVINTLKEKAAQGVKVKVICDSKASSQAKHKLGPNVETIRRCALGLMHQKILVIDEKDCWIGSANMTTESLQMHGNLVMAMHHEAIAKDIIAKSHTVPPQGRSQAFTHKEYVLGDQKMELWFLPDNPDATSHICHLIRGAKESVRVAMFTWTHPEITKEVIAAHKRGIKVQAAIDHYAGSGAGAEVVKKLSDAEVAVRLSQGQALLHYKFLYVDGKLLVNGSANWTRAAFTQNDDCFMILHNLTTSQHEAMEQLWTNIWTGCKAP